MKNSIGLFLTGLGIGIFLGLSESPILLQVLIPLLTIIAGLLSILTGQQNNEKSNANEVGLLNNKNISPFPIMWVVLGMVTGSFLGLFAKNYDITSQGKLFGNKVNSKNERAVDSLSFVIECLQLEMEIKILEKENEYISQAKIDTSKIGLNELIKIKESIKLQKKPLQDSKDNNNNESNSGLRDSKDNPCFVKDLCYKSGEKLAEIFKYESNNDFREILKKYKNSPDSIKIKIANLCNCN